MNSSKCNNLQLLIKGNFTHTHTILSKQIYLCRTGSPLQNKDSLTFLELLRHRKSLKEQRNTIKGKLKTTTQSTNSYTGGEKFSSMFSNAMGQILGRRVITCGQNSSFHHHYVACKQIFA